MAYPWSERVREAMGIDSSLLGLWFDIGEATADVRCRYMELITDCYAENFCEQLGEWCRERGVLYTGHIIEDMDAHTSVMCSAGHYFKSMKGADIASVDVVLNQIKSMENDWFHRADLAPGYSDSTFFNYTLMKLASSCAHIDESKKGRALCEIFGAYGWGESMSEMIYLANHALVRGINYFIPHAFTSEFDNADCPPHFYAGGKNPSNGSYKLLFDYMKHVSEIFSDGRPVIEAAVLYHAQTEWSGGDYDVCDVIAKELMQNQIDFDFVDFEALEQGSIQKDKLVIENNAYRVLIVPYYEKLPNMYQEILDRYQTNIICALKNGTGIGIAAKEYLGCDYESKKDLRVMRYEKNGKYYVMFLNEGEDTIFFRPKDYCSGLGCGAYLNDYISGTYIPIAEETVPIRPLQAFICENEKHGMNDTYYDKKMIIPAADIYLRKYDENEFTLYKHVDDPFFDINRYDECPEFSGFVKIKPVIAWEDVNYLKVEYDAEFCDLHIGDKVYKSIGGCLCCDLSEADHSAEDIYFVLGSGLGNVLRDDFSQCGCLSPCKLISIAISDLS